MKTPEAYMLHSVNVSVILRAQGEVQMKTDEARKPNIWTQEYVERSATCMVISMAKKECDTFLVWTDRLIRGFDLGCGFLRGAISPAINLTRSLWSGTG
jgi:hypothetical protein